MRLRQSRTMLWKCLRVGIVAFAALLAAGLAPRPLPAQSSETLLSRNKPATSSSNETSTLNAPKAVDGLTNTRWSSAASNTQWISVDLGSQQSITHVRLNWEAAYGRAYQIQVSNNGTTWTTIFSTTTGNGAMDDLTGLSGTGRYVRMNGTQRGTQWGYSLWEMEVFGPATPPASDMTAPQVTMTSPTNGANVTAGVPVTLSMTANDTVGVVSSGFTIGGSAVTSPVTLTTLGPVTITATARDAAGNVGTASVTVNVVPDQTPPQVTMTSPANGADVPAGTPVTLSMTATDNVGVVSSGFTIGGSAVTSPVTLTTPGPVTITASARDAAGNVGSASVTVNVVSDQTPPQVTVTSPTDGANVTAGTLVTLSMTATDNTGVVSSGFTIGGSAVTSPVKLTTLGPVTITGTARDAAGNVGTASVTVNVVPDQAAPQVTMTSPANGASVIAGSPVTLSMTATDNVGVVSSGFTIGGSAVTSPVTLTTLGPVIITGTAQDAAGNVGSASVTVNVVGGEVLLSRNKPATSSSNETSTLTPPNAVDGLTNTRWSSAASNPQWLSVDLGSTQSITHVRLNWEAAYGSAYQIQVSDNGTSLDQHFFDDHRQRGHRRPDRIVGQRALRAHVRDAAGHAMGVFAVGDGGLRAGRAATTGYGAAAGYDDVAGRRFGCACRGARDAGDDGYR